MTILNTTLTNKNQQIRATTVKECYTEFCERSLTVAARIWEAHV